MELLELAKEIGKQLQNDETYINMKIAEQNSDNDEVLQNLIGEFNLKRMDINNEASKEDKSDERIRSLNIELRKIYADIMQNENMNAYNSAKQAFDAKFNAVMSIITQCSQGADPETVEAVSSCAGDCSSCGGCH